jgi:hypothetical protein
VDGTRLYEDPIANPSPLFQDPAAVPPMPWKDDPQVGHLMGFVRDESGLPIDTGAVTLSRSEGVAGLGRSTVATATDGGGFYGGVDLAPGTYQVTVTPVGQPAWVAECTRDVVAGAVARLDLTIDRGLPSTGAVATPALLWPPDHQSVPVTLSGTALDNGTGLASISVRVFDEYGLVEPVVEPITIDGGSSLDWTVSFELEAWRDGNDHDGRTYTIEVMVTDKACNVSTSRTTVRVPHDQR